jgi:uncharacterized DUF497 family protein
VRFDWDAGNVEHIRRHKVTREEAEQALQGWPVEVDTQVRNGEVRVLVLGPTEKDRLLAVVFAVRRQAVRVVTARDASRKERMRYAKESKGREA